MLNITNHVCKRANRYTFLCVLALVISLSLVVNASLTELDSLRLSPQSIQLNVDNSLPPEIQAQEQASINFGFDRDTHTEYTAYGNSKITVQLAQETEISQIKIYNAAPYALSVQAWVSGTWQAVEGLQALDLSSLTDQWHIFTVTSTVSTDRLQISLTASTGGSAAGLKELEIWGKAERVTINTGANLLAAVESEEPPVQARIYAASQEEGIIGNVIGLDDSAADNSFSVNIDQDMGSIKRAWLSYESHGAGHWVSVIRSINQQATLGGSYRFASTAWSGQIEAINPAWLISGENSIKFSVPDGNSYRIRKLKLLVELDDGSNMVDEITAAPESIKSTAQFAHDGDDLSGWKPYDSALSDAKNRHLQILFDKVTQLDAIALQLENTLGGKIELETLSNGEWGNAGVGAILGQNLIKGWNRLEIQSDKPVDGIKLLFFNGEGSAGEILEIAPIGSGVNSQQSPPRIEVGYPDSGQYYGNSAYIRGFIQPTDNGSGLVKAFIAGREVSREDGAFEALINKKEFTEEGNQYSVTVDARYPDGVQVSRKIYLWDAYGAAAANAVLKTYASADSASSNSASSGTEPEDEDNYRIEHDESVLQLSKAALEENERPSAISIASLKHEDLPPLDPGMTNVTKGPRNGYRFAPHGKKFRKNIDVYIPYDKTKIPPGLSEQDIKTWYFDEEVGRWVQLEKVSLDTKGKVLKSHTDHFTDMINATLTVPDSPQAANFNPTQIKDIKAADPGAGINLIEPPQANNQGSANLSYPIEIPAGRNGMQPQLAISYNSGGGNGWLGLGWDLSVPSITIDTRWGVPRYSTTQETETYMLNGQQLSPVAHRGAIQNRINNRDDFHTRVEGAFQRIKRHGNSPSAYSWEITDKNGTRNFYGGDETGQDTGSILGRVGTPTHNGGVFKWMLRKTIDANGNTITYNYDFDNDPGIVDGTQPGKQLYIKSIFYTGYGTADGEYSVEFTRDTTRRPDVTIDARGGFKQVTAARLKKIDVKFQDQIIRSYELDYGEPGPFEKSLLRTVAQRSADGTLFNEHKFDYYDDIRDGDGDYTGFLAARSVTVGNDTYQAPTRAKNIDYTVLGGSKGTTTGMEGYGGVGLPVGTKTLNIGLGMSSSQSKSKGSSAFLDVDGDGLPDKVFENSYRRNTTTTGALDDLSFDSEGGPELVSGFSNVAESESTTHNIGLQAFLFGLSANGGMGMTDTNEKSYLTDVNGDGLTDIVKRGAVWFNKAKNTGDPGFTKNSYETDLPIGNVGGSVSDDVIPNMDDRKERMEAENPLMDNVRRWVAPYNGSVRITGSVKLVDFKTDPRFSDDEQNDRKEYAYADGVRVAIQHNDDEEWHVRIKEDELEPVTPDVTLPVQKGDVIYFRVGSFFDGNYDLVDWSPSVEYVRESEPDRLDVNGLPVFSYNAASDFIYSNRELELTVPYKGTLRLAGKLNKSRVTTDDVTIQVTVISRELNSDNTLKSEMHNVIVSKTIPWNSTDPLILEDAFSSINVERYNGVKIHFSANSPIDLNAFSWGDSIPGTDKKTNLPKLYYTSAWQEQETPLVPVEDAVIPPEDEQPTDGDELMDEAKNPPDMQPIKEGDDDFVIPGRWFAPGELYAPDTGEPLMAMPVKYDTDIYPANHLTRPQDPWVAEKDGVIFLTPWVSIKKYIEEDDEGNVTKTYTKARDGSIFITIKRRNELIGKHEVVIEDGAIVNEQGYDTLKVFEVSKGDKIYYDASIRPKSFTDAERQRAKDGEINLSLDEEIDSAVVKIHYASDEPWKVPLTDNIDFLATLDGHTSSCDDDDVFYDDDDVFCDDDDVVIDKRYMFVIRHGKTDVAFSRVASGTDQKNYSYNTDVEDGDDWYFDVFTVESRLSVPKRIVQARYKTDSNWSVPFNGTVSFDPVLHFKSTNVPDGDVELRVMRAGTVAAKRTYRVQGGVVKNPLPTPLSLPVTKNQTLEFVYYTPSHALSAYLADKGSVSIDYIDRIDWQVPDSDTISPDSDTISSVAVTPEPKLTGSSIEDGAVLFRIMRGNTELASRSFTVSNGTISSDETGPLTVPASAEQNLNFIYETESLSIAKAMQASKVSVSVLGNNINVPFTINLVNQVVNSRFFYIAMPVLFDRQLTEQAVRHFPLEDPLWGDPYRGWGTAAYNGDGDRASAAINRSIFKMHETEAKYKQRDTVHYAWVSYPEEDKERWGSMDNNWWTGPVEASASRKGRDYIFIPNADDYAVTNSASTEIPDSGDFVDPVFDSTNNHAGAARPPKMGESDTTNYGFGFVLSLSSSSNETKSLLDVMDMNGDRFPDVVGENGTQYTWADGTLFDYYDGIGRARESKEDQETIGFGPGAPSSSTEAEGRKPTTGDKVLAELSSFPFSGSIAEAENEIKTDLIDVNGDGLPDRILPGLSVALNNGYGFEPPESWGGGFLHKGESESKAVGVGFSMWNSTMAGGINLSEAHNFGNVGMMDINGDGLADAVEAGDGGVLNVWINTGGGFVDDPVRWKGALQAYNKIGKGPGGGYRSLTPLSDGGSTSASGSLKFGFGFNVFFINFSFSFGGNFGETVSQPAISYQDVNGDGFVDGIRSSNSDTMEVALNPIRRTNMLRSVSRPMGGTIDIAYKRIGNTFKYPQSKYVMSEVKVFDGVEDKVNGEGSDYQLARYSYEDGFYSRYERDFYGFKTVTQQQYDTTNKGWGDLDGLDDDDVFRRTTQSYYNESVYFKGMLDTETTHGRDTRTSNLEPFTGTDNTYSLILVEQFAADKPGSRFPALTDTTKFFYEGGTGTVSTRTEHVYDEYGNVTTFKDFGVDGDGTDDVVATIEYTGCEDSYIVGKATSILVEGADNTWRKRTGTIDCETGNLTDQYAWLEDSGANAHTQLDYDNTYGNLIKVTGPKNEDNDQLVLNFEYDDVLHTHVKHINNESFNIDSYAYTDPKWGKPQWTEDINGNRIEYRYDNFGRTIKIAGPYESINNPTIEFDYKPIAALATRTPGNAPVAIDPHWAKTTHFDRDWLGNAKNNTIDTVLFTDGIKRVLQTKKDATINGTNKMIVSGRVLFDGLGRTVAQYYPVHEPKAESALGNTGFSTGIDTSASRPTTMVYDALDRNVSTTIPDGTTTTMAYSIDGNRLKTTVSDACTNAKETYRDVRELILMVKEFTDAATTTGDDGKCVKGGIGSTALTTTYAYDSLKQITDVIDAKGNLTKVSYDNLGRRTHIVNPDTGDVETVYDLAGNVIKKITPNLRATGQFIGYNYDRTRLVGITYPQNQENNVSYIYGNTGNAASDDRAATPANTVKGDGKNQIGRILTVTHGSGQETREYGKLGETTTTHTTIVIRSPDKTYTTRFKYDTFGRLLVLNFPDGEELRHDYDSGGNLNHIEGQKRGGTPHVYLDTLHYDKFEQRTYMKLGNGVETTYDYKEDNRRLQTLVSHQPNKRRANGRQFQNIHYGYDEVGNITTLANKIDVPANKDMGGPTQQTFGYDKLYRLTSASGGYETARAMNNYTLNMVYDGIHNINQKTQTHDITSKNGGIKVQKGTTYDFGYTYNPSGQNSKQPHAPQKIGNRDFTYDANGNQTGFTSTETSNRRVIQWDEENRIRSIADKGKTSTYTYDDSGQRTTKKNDQGEVAYISQFYVVRNGSIPSKHIYAGTTRILTKRLGGGNPTYSPSPTHPRGNPHDPSQANGNGGNGNGGTDKTNNGKGTNKTQTTTATASVDTGHPGQGLIHRAERANEVAQNTVKNKHLNGTGLPAPENPDKGNNGQGSVNGNGGNSGNTGNGGNGQSVGAGGQGGNSAWKPEEEFMYYYHPDHLGSTGYVTDEDGLLYEHIEYFPFGETWVQESTVTERTPYLYTSKEFDEDTKLYYYGARYYDPRTSVWQSVDPVLGKYLEGAPSGGVYITPNLNLYHYSAQNPVRFKDDNGEFINFFVGAALGAGFDFAVQTVLIVTHHQDSYDGKSMLISAAAGATGVGLAALASKAAKLGTAAKVIAEIAADVSVSAGSKVAKGEEVTVGGVVSDVVLGQAGGRAAGKVARSKAKDSPQNAILGRVADRAERIANNPKVGRPAARQRQAGAAKQRQQNYLNNAELRGGLVGSGAGQSVGQLMNPPEVKDDQ